MGLRTVHPDVFTLLGPLPSVAALSVQAGFSPEGSAEQLVLQTIEIAQHNIRLMGYSFTSSEAVRALISAIRRGVDVKVVLGLFASNP
ncbi:endonuclease [Salmonella enterica subsp. enterica serovar Teshie]|nr:endonuclease [Salmonella enterica subsp. enterica serovar Teshie]EEE7594023.1 endonuclease [Salmonella enterica subsp. enterica serovar Teshie]